MSESDTMFNEWDRRCAGVQLMFSTDPSYDNRTIASTLKMQIVGLPRITGTCPRWWKQSSQLRLWSLVWFQVRATSCHLTSSKSAWKSTKSVPGCAEECGDPLVQSGGRWQTLGVAAGLGAGPQVQRDPGLASEGVLRLCTLLSLAPLLPWLEPTGLPRLIVRREYHQHDLPQNQSQPDRRHPPISRRRLWKKHAPSSGSVSRRWLRLKVATLNRCQLNYIIKLAGLIFPIRVLK